METSILTLTADPEAEGLVREAAAVLSAGGVIAYPTETFYGLGAAANCAPAVARVRALKGRDAGKPLPLIAAGVTMVRSWARLPAPPAFERLAAAFWPGPLTLVLPAGEAAPLFVRGPGETIGIRVPPAAWLRRLIETLGVPITSTSANLAGEGEIDEPAAVLRLFRGRVDLIIDGGATPGGRPSTVLDLGSDPPLLLRAGAVAEAAIRECLKVAHL